MPGPTTLRPLLRGDRAAVVRIDRERTGRSRTEYYAKRFQVLEDPRLSVALAAEQGDQVVGFALARVLDGEFGGAAPVGALDAIGVAAEQEREGVATALLSGVEVALRARGVREVRTQVELTEHGVAAFFSSCGFRLSPRIVLERSLERPADRDEEDEEHELPVRSMTERDVPAIIRLDRKITGRDRTAYLTRKATEVLNQSAVRVSLVAEVEGRVAGFLMALVDFGEFGRTEPSAVLDTIGVDPDHRRRRIGRALLDQLLLNLGGLRVERVLTEVEWSDLSLVGFLGRTGFCRAQRLSLEKVLA